MSLAEKVTTERKPTRPRKLIRATKFLNRRVSFSRSREISGPCLDPQTVRWVRASLVKHQKAYEYLKNH